MHGEGCARKALLVIGGPEGALARPGYLQIGEKPIALCRRRKYAAFVSSVGSASDVHKRLTASRLLSGSAPVVAHYRLGPYLQQGGMATVFLGKRVAPGGFEKTVVLKKLHPELASQPLLLALFFGEARLAARLQHPCIVQALDVVQLDGDYYVVLEYVRGGDLRLLLRRAKRRGQQFSAAAGLYIGRELCSALERAHSLCGEEGRPLGLIHRDISPANVLLSADGEVKLGDFGIAQASGLAPSAERALGPKLRGKIGYMSPEQAAGAEVDARSDLFSLAAVLYEVLTGRRLFVGQPEQSPAEIYRTAIEPPSRLCAELPPELDSILARALQLVPSARYQSAHELEQALQGLMRRHQLWMDRASLAEHLRAVCGPDPESWSRMDERTATAVISGVSLEDGEEDRSADLDESRADSRGFAVEQTALKQVVFDAAPVITVPWEKLTEGPSVTSTDSSLGEQSKPSSSDDTMPLPALLVEPESVAEHYFPPSEDSVTALPGLPSLTEPGLADSGLPALELDAVTSPAALVEPGDAAIHRVQTWPTWPAAAAEPLVELLSAHDPSIQTAPLMLLSTLPKGGASLPLRRSWPLRLGQLLSRLFARGRWIGWLLLALALGVGLLARLLASES